MAVPVQALDIQEALRQVAVPGLLHAEHAEDCGRQGARVGQEPDLALIRDRRDLVDPEAAPPIPSSLVSCPGGRNSVPDGCSHSLPSCHLNGSPRPRGQPVLRWPGLFTLQLSTPYFSLLARFEKVSDGGHRPEARSLSVRGMPGR